MRELPSRNAVLAFMFSMLSVTFLLLFNFDKSHSLLIDKIINFGHVPLFMVVAAMVLWILDWKNWPLTSLMNYILTGLISCILSFITEVLQQITPGRSFELNDIIHDIMGCTIFLLLIYQYRRNVQKKTSLVLSLTAVLLLILAAMPFIIVSLDEIRAGRDFPLLASFETDSELGRWKIEEKFERTPLYSTHRQHALRVDLSPGLYPGVSLNYPPRNWKGYDTLTFDAFLEGADPLALTVRINDLAHNEEYEDRYNRTFTLQSGPNQLSISLSEVEHAPKGRLMDMEHISILCIFSYKLKEPRTVYFDNFRLEKDS